MRTTIPKPADRDEWLAARAPYIGASEAAALVGEHPFLSLGELAVEKLRGAPVRDDTSAMRRGRFLEHAVAGWWEEEHGIALVEPDELYVYDDTLIATLDRRVVGTNVAVEIKTSNRYVGDLARSWYWQAQVQMLCADLDQVHVVVLDPRMELQLFEVEPDEEDQHLVAEAARKFLHHVRAGELPPDTELTYRAAASLHPEVHSQSVDLDADALRWCRSLAALQERIRSLQADEDALKGMIAHRLGDAAEGMHEGRLLCTWRAVTRHDLDRKKLRAEHPDIAQECATTTTYRQLRMVKP
jgi:putative phage-type endonuclease